MKITVGQALASICLKPLNAWLLQRAVERGVAFCFWFGGRARVTLCFSLRAIHYDDAWWMGVQDTG